jgi:hypothetical protein
LPQILQLPESKVRLSLCRIAPAISDRVLTTVGDLLAAGLAAG